MKLLITYFFTCTNTVASTRRYNKVHRKREMKQSASNDEKERRNHGSHALSKSNQVENGRARETDKNTDTTKGHTRNDKEVRRPASASSSRRSSREKQTASVPQDKNSPDAMEVSDSDEETDDAEETIETNRKLQYEDNLASKQTRG